MIQGGVNPEIGLEWFERLFRRVAASIRASTFTRSPSRKSSGFRPSRIARPRGARAPAGRRDEIAAGRRRGDSRRARSQAHLGAQDQAGAWLGVMREAQLLGMPTTATMMFGSIETEEERIEHMNVLRELQDETGGFTAFIPWYYVPFKTPLRGKEAMGLEYLRVLAISRLYSITFRTYKPRGSRPHETRSARPVLRMRRHGGTIIEEQVVHDAARPTKRRAAISRRPSSAPASGRSFATRTGICATTSRWPPPRS